MAIAVNWSQQFFAGRHRDAVSSVILRQFGFDAYEAGATDPLIVGFGEMINVARGHLFRRHGTKRSKRITTSRSSSRR